jgi:hypothetical protein
VVKVLALLKVTITSLDAFGYSSYTNLTGLGSGFLFVMLVFELFGGWGRGEG